jgi:hypothetical protein
MEFTGKNKILSTSLTAILSKTDPTPTGSRMNQASVVTGKI